MAERVGSNILEVDPDQDLTDLVYRLREIPGDAGLVIPPGAPQFQRDESLQVLKRQALSSGRRLAVITADADIQARARAAGLEAFVDRAAFEASAGTAPSAPVARPPRQPVRRFPVDRRLGAAALGLTLIALLAATILVPTVTVTLSVVGSRVQTDARLVGAPGNYNSTFLSFNTRTLDATTSESQSAPASQKAIPAVAAGGEVVLTALCGSPIELGPGTVVETADGKQYATKGSVTLCQSGASASATTGVSALVAGSAENVPAYSLTRVKDMPAVTVTNPGPLTGGADARTATVVQESDVDALRQQLISRIDAATRAQLKAMAGGWHVIASAYPQFSAQISPPVGTEATTVSVTVTEVLQGVSFLDRDVHARLRDAIKVRVPPGYALTGDPIKTWYEVEEANEDGHVALSGHGLAYAVPVFDARALARTITGHSPGSARAQLRKLPAVVRVDISQRPVPLPWLPMQPSHVFIQVFETAVGSA